MLKRTSGQLKFSLLRLSTNSEYQPIRRLRSFCALQLLNVPAAAERIGAEDPPDKQDAFHQAQRVRV